VKDERDEYKRQASALRGDMEQAVGSLIQFALSFNAD
jgi:hypothetical protein